MTTERRLEQLPVFPDVVPDGPWQSLTIDGLVETPLTLSESDLAGIARRNFTDDFRCIDGWVAPDQRWEGIPLAELLIMAGASPDANFLACSAGSYTVGLPISEVWDDGAIVALRLNDEPLPEVHGGPCRLVAIGKQCHYSVKWLDRISVVSAAPEDTGLEIVQVRNANRSE